MVNIRKTTIISENGPPPYLQANRDDRLRNTATWSIIGLPFILRIKTAKKRQILPYKTLRVRARHIIYIKNYYFFARNSWQATYRYCIITMTIRLGQWGCYALKAELLNFSVLCEAQSRSGKTRVGLQLLFYLTGVGQYLSCFIKCVGAKCTKRCYRV